MAETALTVRTTGQGGSAENMQSVDTSDNNKVQNNGNMRMNLYNADGANAAVVTLTTQQTIQGLAIADKAISLAATQRKTAGPFPPDLYNDSSGNIIITTTGDGAASVDIDPFI